MRKFGDCERTTTDSCICCGGVYPLDAHHIKSRGSGGPDTPWNLVTVCRSHHRLWHDRGNNYMADLYPGVLEFFNEHGWERCPLTNKWKHNG